MPVQSPDYNPPIPQVPAPGAWAFGPSWVPDLPALNASGSPNARNVVPRTPTSFGPVPGMVPLGATGLVGRCQGACAVLDSNGFVQVFAGDATDLYQNNLSLGQFVKVSKLGGYATYATNYWNFEFMNGIVVATNGTDNPQAFTLGTSSSFLDLAGGVCPRGKYMAVIKNFLMFADTSDNIIVGPGYAQAHQRAWWSPLNNPFVAWPTPGSVSAITQQSSYNDIFGKQGYCQGLVGNLGNADGAMFFDHAVYRIMYAGPPVVFDFLPAQAAKGCPAPQSIVQIGALAYYLGEDGFYSFDGVNTVPIGANFVDKYFYSDLIASLAYRTIGAVDPVNKLIYWAYCGAGSTGNPNHIIVYNWQLNSWSILDLTTEMLVRLLTVGFTLDQLYTILGYTIDGLPAPLDSRVWTGGLLSFGMFDAAHRLNFLTGPNLAATIDTPEVQASPGQRSLIDGAMPLIDGGNPSIAIGSRERLIDPVVWGTPQAINSLGECPLYTSGRFQRARLTTLAGDTWTNAMGVVPSIQAIGAQ